MAAYAPPSPYSRQMPPRGRMMPPGRQVPKDEVTWGQFAWKSVKAVLSTYVVAAAVIGASAYFLGAPPADPTTIGETLHSFVGKAADVLLPWRWFGAGASVAATVGEAVINSDGANLFSDAAAGSSLEGFGAATAVEVNAEAINQASDGLASSEGWKNMEMQDGISNQTEWQNKIKEDRLLDQQLLERGI